MDVFKLELAPSNKLALLEEVANNFRQQICFLMESCSPQISLEKEPV